MIGLIFLFFAILSTLLVLNRTVGDIATLVAAVIHGHFKDNYKGVRIFLYTIFSLMWTLVFWYYN